MLRLLKSKKAQNTMEYALLIAVVIGAFTAMQLYMRRSMNEKIKAGMDNAHAAIHAQLSAVDQKNDTGIFFGNDTVHQYEPYYYREGSENMTTTTGQGTERETIQGNAAGAGGIRELANATTKQSGNQSLSGFNNTTYNWTTD